MKRRSISHILVFAILSICLIIIAGTSQAQNEGVNPLPSFIDEDEDIGSFYYLRADSVNEPPYLRPNNPIDIGHTSVENRFSVGKGETVYVPFIRADLSSMEDVYIKDANLTPRVSLIVNSGNTVGKVLHIEIWFDFDGLAKKESDVDAKAVFKDYTTHRKDSTEQIDLLMDKQVGEFKDFQEGADKGNIKVVITRKDSIDEDLLVYCGAVKTLSWIIVPYRWTPYDSENATPPDDDDDSISSEAYVALAVFIVGGLVMAVIVYYLYSNRMKKETYEEPDDKYSKRRKKDRQKAKRDRYLRNRKK